MKLFYLILFLLLSCTHQQASNCLQTKMTLDIGSGTTKYYIAQVNHCQHKIIKVTAKDSFAFPFKQSLTQSNNFPQQLQQKFIVQLKKLITKFNPDIIQSVATSAFRTANNGKKFATTLNQKLNLNLQIISQKEEALLGYHAVKGIVHHSPILYWDIGGGSMQIIQELKSGPQIYKGKIGAVSFKDLVLKQVFHNKQTSPNPLGKKYKKTLQLAKNFAQKTLPKSFINLKLPVYGIGGVHQYAILKNNKKNSNFYTQAELKKWLMKKSKLNNQQLGGKYASTDVTNLALVLGFMEILKVNKVQVIPNINMAYALLYKW